MLCLIGMGATGGMGGAVGGVMGGAMGRATSGPIGAGGGDHMPPHGTSWTHTQAPTHYSPSSRYLYVCECVYCMNV